jgi:hypothetical protein
MGTVFTSTCCKGESPTNQPSVSDETNLRNVKEINKLLESFAEDDTFQEDLKRPLVQAALNHWSGIETVPSEERADEIKSCAGVNSVYPKIKKLEDLCIKAQVPVPIDHVREAKRKLDDVALLKTFGPEFCRRNDLIKSSGCC